MARKNKSIKVLFVSALLLIVHTLAADPGYYVQQGGPDGIVCIEAENFAAKQAGDDNTWELTTDKAGFSGKGAMASVPDIGSSEDIDYGDSPNIL